MLNDKFMARSIDEMIWESEVFTSINAVASELFFDSEDLVVFGESFRSRGSTSFDLSG